MEKVAAIATMQNLNATMTALLMPLIVADSAASKQSGRILTNGGLRVLISHRAARLRE